ncbi:hypothetical protein Vretimale_1906 [Volvox reticuliferus]|uniref:Uncharacterized protein n=1 Tax=Volvox reticuliferus TaxID=1737510 RepID=A0A8J4CTI4_9CHLO|nr:hypothetical protein Vretifemale_17358 [Volvox reticuliferus]GIL95998.1 hypothetical protein Vretimale_1906 [Volvox reticuliferus]
MLSKGHCRFASTGLLSAIALLLGCLFQPGDAFPSSVVPKYIDNAAWFGQNPLGREVLSTRSADGQPTTIFFEQAFTSTFNTKDPDQVSRTLLQYGEVIRWIEHTPQLNATQLAFLPEFGSAAVLEIVQTAIKLERDNNTNSESLMVALADLSSKLRAASTKSPWRGFAATRRVLLGMILKKRVNFGGRFPSDVEASVDSLLLQLFQLHKASAAARGAVQFFHVSKSGGTNLCHTAGANGCTSQGFDTRTNCLIRDFFDQPRWVSYNAHKYLQYRMSSRQGLPWFVNFHSFRPPYSCEQRRAYLLRDGFNFYANEYTNPPASDTTATVTIAAGSSTSSSAVNGTTADSLFVAAAAAAPSSCMCEQDFVNLLMLRHPHDRLRSQIGWLEKLYKEYYLDVDTQPAFYNRTSGFWERLMPAGVNNYYIRSLLGSRFFEYPVLEVSPQHATLAKLAALQHDILLVLEDKGRSELALRFGLGWSTAGLRDDAVRSSSELGDDVALPLDYPSLLARNAPDVELYSFAREMQALDTLLWNFVAAMDERLGGALVGVAADAKDTDTAGGEMVEAHCGYVSMGSPESVAGLVERLRGVEVPPKLAVAASATPIAAPAGLAGGGRNGSGARLGGSGILQLGDFGQHRIKIGGRGPSVVSINRRNGRRLLRLKTQQGWVRHRKPEHAAARRR